MQSGVKCRFSLFCAMEETHVIERNHIFQQFLPFGLVFGQLAWEWLKLSFATLKAYFLANYEGKTNE